MQPVQSHAIEAIAYDEREHRLIAKYRDSGRTVTYEDVPPELYDTLMFADSIGRFFQTHIEGHFRKVS